ncbi:helix-turn-helix domain-containing protein [Microbacterium timonense]|uniref:helix-turn-helix domain-containing protein n=1 Tax=Microbacterium timonense TaxID=2086576 RepID=UPI0011B27599|nr:helix-turn-helix transcriptional regulator [Microbacterium timonense]
MTNALGAYLKARRGMVRLYDSGDDSAARRVTGSRVEEVAHAAGISASYYRRLEQGRVAMPSQQVLARLADALQLDASGAAYLSRLAGIRPFREPRLGAPSDLDVTLSTALERWSHLPAAVQTRNFDIVLINRLFEALTNGTVQPGANFVELFFCGEAARQAPDWEETAAHNVAALRYYGDPADVRFRELTGGLLVRDRDFRRLWSRYDAEPFDAGRSWHVAEGFGTFSLSFRNLIIPGSGGHLLTVFIAEPGSVGEAALRELAEA